MRRTTSWMMGTLFLFFLLGHLVDAQEEKAPRWFDPILASLRSRTHSEISGFRRSAFERIREHAFELRRLESQGYNAAQIRSCFATRYPRATSIKASGSSASFHSGAISGTLYEKGAGPIQSYASVQIYDEFGRYAGYDSTGASEKGMYKIEDLEPGKYFVYAGSRVYGYKYFRNTTNWRKAKLVHVKKKTVKGINIKFDLERGSGAIEGAIRQKSGIPIPEAEITAYAADGHWAGSGVSDASGRYRISDLVSGKYKLEASFRRSGAYVSRWYKNSSQFDDADLVRVTEPHTRSGINFVIPPGGALSGRIISSTGKAVGAYEAGLEVYDIHQNYIRSSSTDEKGRIKFVELTPGRYKLYIVYFGAENNMEGWYPNAPSFNKAKVIKIAAGQNKSLRIKLRRGGILSGLVTNFDGQPPPEGSYSTIYDLDGYLVKYGKIDEDGAFEAIGLPTGTYKVRIDTSCSSSSPGMSPCSEWYNDAFSFDEATPIQVHAPRTTGNINIHLDRGGHIIGRLSFGEYSYPSGGVQAYDMKGNSVRSTYVGFDGIYFLDGLPSGTYKLRAYSLEGWNYMFVWYGNKQNFAAARSVTITGPGGVTGIDMTLEPRADVSGFLTNKKGNRLSRDDIDINVYAFRADTGEYATSGSNSFSGGYTIRPLRGSYKIAAVRCETADNLKKNMFSRTFYPCGHEFHSPENHIVWTAPLDKKKLNKLVMNSAPGSISGKILDQKTGRPLDLNFLTVMAFDQNGFLAAISRSSDDQGAVPYEYSLTGLRPGTYYLVLMAYYDCGNRCQEVFAWYGGEALSVEEMAAFAPRIAIPVGAMGVIVGEGDTSGIDFHVKR